MALKYANMSSMEKYKDICVWITTLGEFFDCFILTDKLLLHCTPYDLQ